MIFILNLSLSHHHYKHINENYIRIYLSRGFLKTGNIIVFLKNPYPYILYRKKTQHIFILLECCARYYLVDISKFLLISERKI